jgi:hypothetical protein
MTEEQRKARDKAQAKYDAAHTTRVYLKLNNETDADILDRLGKEHSKQGFIKECIRRVITHESAHKK